MDADDEFLARNGHVSDELLDPDAFCHGVHRIDVVMRKRSRLGMRYRRQADNAECANDLNH